MTYITV